MATNSKQSRLSESVNAYRDQLKSVYSDFSLDKVSRTRRSFGLINEAVERILEGNPEESRENLNKSFEELTKSILKDMALKENVRVDGRDTRLRMARI